MFRCITYTEACRFFPGTFHLCLLRPCFTCVVLRRSSRCWTKRKTDQRLGERLFISFICCPFVCDYSKYILILMSLTRLRTAIDDTLFAETPLCFPCLLPTVKLNQSLTGTYNIRMQAFSFGLSLSLWRIGCIVAYIRPIQSPFSERKSSSSRIGDHVGNQSNTCLRDSTFVTSSSWILSVISALHKVPEKERRF